MATGLSAPPVLSTPDNYLFDHVEPAASTKPIKSDDDLRAVYETARTAREIRTRRARRIALQLPDHMLVDAPRLVGVLTEELRAIPDPLDPDTNATEEEAAATATAAPAGGGGGEPDTPRSRPAPAERLYILADTSYSACCVDEVAAEHVAADLVVHYGRACLSPTARLPALHVYTRHALDHDAVARRFAADFPDRATPVVLVADVVYQDHVGALARRLAVDMGYTAVRATAVARMPLARIPNRAIEARPDEAADMANDGPRSLVLAEHAVFHVGTPPAALLLALASRVRALHIFAVDGGGSNGDDKGRGGGDGGGEEVSAARLLGRRYAKVLTLATAGVVGILVNTLSVANYLASVAALRARLAAAGKKSYTVVVGKLNPAKLANFAEIDGWVVVGCWESSLVEDDAGFFRPVVTPFELEIALTPEHERVWTGEWWGGIEGLTLPDGPADETTSRTDHGSGGDEAGRAEGPREDAEGGISDDESAPPEFDLRTGKLVSHSRPMRAVSGNAKKLPAASSALALRAKSELATVNGVVSPGAEYLRSQRTWQGLGTDFDDEEKSTAIEEGRGGIARGYHVGDDAPRR